MSSLNWLFRKEDRFFTLLEASAGEARTSAQALAQLLAAEAPAKASELLVHSRAQDLKIHEEIDQLLCQGGATPLEREDIEALARALYRIPKAVRKLAERYQLCAKRIPPGSLAVQAGMLGEATEAVYQMVCELTRSAKIPAAEARNEALQKIENNADQLFVRAMVNLYQGGQDPLAAIMLKDLYELAERVFDRCRFTGNLILRTVLKIS